MTISASNSLPNPGVLLTDVDSIDESLFTNQVIFLLTFYSILFAFSSITIFDLLDVIERRCGGRTNCKRRRQTQSWWKRQKTYTRFALRCLRITSHHNTGKAPSNDKFSWLHEGADVEVEWEKEWWQVCVLTLALPLHDNGPRLA